jgi:ATP-binding cassette subfamily F protein 3
MIRTAPNLLLLDEPTNHLDLEMREALTIALQETEAGMVLVSHDRHLLRATCDELWLVADGKVTPFDGDLDDYADWLAKARSAEKTAERDKAPVAKQAPVAEPKKATPASKKLKQESEKLEQQIAGWQAELKLLETRLTDPALYAGTQASLLAELGQRQNLLTQSIDAAESRWLELNEQLEVLEEE